MKHFITPKQEIKLCGQNIYNSENCTNKIRKTSQNRFEIITLIGKHAFGYKVIIQSKNSKSILKTIGFPTREQALNFFALTENKYR